MLLLQLERGDKVTKEYIPLFHIEDIVKSYVLVELKKQSEIPSIINLSYEPSDLYKNILTKEDLIKTEKFFGIINSKLDIKTVGINNTNNNLIAIINNKTNNNYDIDGCTTKMLNTLKSLNLSLNNV